MPLKELSRTSSDSEAMNAFTFHHSTKIIFGRGSLSKLGEEAARFGKKCLLVSGRNFAKRSGFLEEIEKNLAGSGLSTTIYDKVEPNPSIETVYGGSDTARRDGCDVVIALGGGSAMDAAKAIAFLASNDVKLEDSFAPNEVLKSVLPIVAMPTTCGTGSELTKYSVLTDVAARRKRVLFGLPILPKVALLDPVFLDGLSKQMVAYTGFDALSHGFEALLSKTSNGISDMLATESITTMCRNLEGACGGSPESRERALFASTLAGAAINSTGTVIVHGMGYYLTNYHEVHHGLANALLLPHVLRFEGECAKDKLERVALNLGIPDVPSLLDQVEDIADAVGIPKNLSEVGIGASELDLMAKDAMTYSRNLDNNPVKVTEGDIRGIVAKALLGRT